MSDTALAVHRAFYDAVETGDVDLMASLWVDHPRVSCVHPGAAPLRGTSAVLRSWTVLMAQVSYIQFFLTDVDVTTLPIGAQEPTTAVIVCTENILSGEGMSSPEAFAGGKALCTSILVRDLSGGRTAGDWKFWSRHASPIAEMRLETD
ncbi:nuclear transport factor 2 family protein [Aeromicrobium wangtongii]|uniref:Nuclear transport factor 2 family protein n=1 Tax=Aeromicrobium wangtongii TaxID=2969247 RepID=A0ABY5M5B1_9ACTN|nr:nuclear transport factor 2 family protein [Aeromicrobium wangtongii]MCD9200099.1 nuclear transport factor 2 family protein [Aeromicrobium wangtongii]UUP13355.1 nuclear transport factor 2 family protein [Aeromicrobium wangtongii]